MPSSPISSSLPTKGLIYVAPASAAMIAWFSEKHRVKFTLIFSLESCDVASMPARLAGILTAMLSAHLAISLASAIIPGASRLKTSVDTGPGTTEHISCTSVR